MPKKTVYKNANNAWQQLFKDKFIYSEVEHKGSFELSAKDINEYYECRLMTKHDHAAARPLSFTSEHQNLSILPISRKKFRIGKYDIYQNLNDFHDRPIYTPLLDNLVSLPTSAEGIRSEQIALACCYTSEILRKFIQIHCADSCEVLLPTLSGRMGSTSFDFVVKNGTHEDTIKVDRAQIEIDAVYESENAIYLIEAKNHECRDFLIRQLYYPYRLLCNMTNCRKPIIPIFMKYVSGCYHFYRFSFEDINHLNSISLKSQAQYSVIDARVSLADLDEVLQTTIPLSEPPDIPFPQADSIERVLDLVHVLHNEGTPMSREKICELNLDFTPRQAKYYADAGAYLGLTRHDGMNVVLSKNGTKLAASPLKVQTLGYIQLILQHYAFHKSLQLAMSKGGLIPSNNELALIIAEQHHLGESTLLRRAQTIRAWLKWILGKVDLAGDA